MPRSAAIVSILLIGLLARPLGALDTGLEGRVLLPDGSPAVDATVSILGQTGSTRTGADGSFRWLPRPAVPFSVLVVLPGGIYSEPVLVEALPDEGPVLVRLALVVSDSVTVSAGATPYTETPPAGAAGVVGRSEIFDRQPTTLTDSIESIPGVGRVGEGLSVVPSVRGLARGRTLLLIDGTRVTSERRAGPSATFLDPFVLEAVEVARGLGAVGYGSDAFGGVIHARTRQATPATPWKGRAQVSLGAGIPEKSLGLELQRGWHDGGFIVQGRYRDFDDYESPAGTVADSFGGDSGVRLRLDQELGPGRLQLGYQRDRARESGKPSAVSDTVRSLYPAEQSDRFLLGYEPDPAAGFSRWSVHGFLGRYRLLTDRDRLATAATPRQLSRSDVSAWDYGLRAAGTRGLGGWRLELGLDLNGRTGLEALGSETFFAASGPVVTEQTAIEDAARRDLGAFASLDGILTRWLTASAGLRVDRVTTRNSGGYFGDRSTGHSSTSGLVALTGGPLAGVTVTAQVGRGFRDPTLSDRYYRGVSGRGFITGNPELEPETSLQWDLAVRRTGTVRSAAYLYRYRIEDLVERYRAGADFYFRNRGRARLQGIELELEAPLPGGLRLELGAQAAEGVSLDDGAALDDVPTLGATLTLRRALGERGSVYARALLRASDDQPGPTERATPAWATLDLSGRWRFGRLEARLLLRNVFDARYPSSPDEDTVPAPGRSALVTLSAGF